MDASLVAGRCCDDVVYLHLLLEVIETKDEDGRKAVTSCRLGPMTVSSGINREALFFMVVAHYYQSID